MKRSQAFTLIELLVVMSIIAILITIAAPRYFQHVERSKEAVLRENLATLRTAIDQYHADKGRWPASLDSLATDRYIRTVPKDPVTDRADTWIAAPPPEGGQGVYDVHSGAQGIGLDGTAYAEW